MTTYIGQKSSQTEPVECEMHPLINLTPTRRLSSATERCFFPPLENLTPQKLPSLTLLNVLTPPTSVFPSPMERSNSARTDTSSVVSTARKYSIDTADNSNSECPELSELEESFLRAVSHNKISEVKRFLDEKVNINVQNGFKR